MKWSQTLEHFLSVMLLALFTACSQWLMSLWSCASFLTGLREDAINLTLLYIMQHMESPHAYGQILFMISPLLLTQPGELLNKLMDIGTTVSHWILNILLQRAQRLRMGSLLSQPLSISKGASPSTQIPSHTAKAQSQICRWHCNNWHQQ